MPKPFSTRELIARIKALLRRTQRSQQLSGQDRIVIGDLVVDAGKHEVSIAAQPVKLTVTEFKLLRHLAANPGRAFSREQLLDHVVGDGVVVTDWTWYVFKCD